MVCDTHARTRMREVCCCITLFAYTYLYRLVVKFVVLLTTQFEKLKVVYIHMYEYVYVYICMYACMHACMYVCMYVCRWYYYNL